MAVVVKILGLENNTEFKLSHEANQQMLLICFNIKK